MREFYDFFEYLAWRPSMFFVYDVTDAYFAIYGWLLSDMLYFPGRDNTEFKKFNNFISEYTGIEKGYRWDLKITLHEPDNLKALNLFFELVNDFKRQDKEYYKEDDIFFDFCYQLSIECQSHRYKFNYVVENIKRFNIFNINDAFIFLMLINNPNDIIDKSVDARWYNFNRYVEEKTGIYLNTNFKHMIGCRAVKESKGYGQITYLQELWRDYFAEWIKSPPPIPPSISK